MLRTKKEVDRHVQDIFRKLQDENERTLRCYKIAELYYNVNDFESARRYLSRYVEVRKEAKAHKLMGQILEALNQKEAALVQYKYAFELDGKQVDLILKVCELMADPEVEIDLNRARYWSERADKLFPRHKILFQLKEKILSIERPTNNEEDLENLITAELAARPLDVQLRVKLLKHYIEKNKFDDAYKHATEIEIKNIHRNSLPWYQVLCELYLKCKSNKQSNWNFWILYISALERYAALSLKEQGNVVKKTSEAMQAIYNFDQHLFEAKSQTFTSNPSATESQYLFTHMFGQLHLHMACLLLQNTKREQGSWTEAGRLCAPLIFIAMLNNPIDLTNSDYTIPDDSMMKKLLQLWYREGSYRCSQAGHVLQDYARGNPKRLLGNIEKFCTGSWRERVYQRIFVGKIYQKIRTSYFVNSNTMYPLYPRYRLLSHNELKRYDEVAEEVWPYSLHHQVWPGITPRHVNNNQHAAESEGPQPHLSSHLFPELQFSVYNLNQASPVTLCRLDIDAFLNAAVLCASIVVEEQRKNSLLNPDRLPTLPADLTNPLCPEEQEKWWAAAYKTYHKEVLDNIGETRQILQRGLEVVRCIGNHGLHPSILVHLARIFSYRAKRLKEKNPESSDIPALESRAELYWSAAVPLLERLQNNQTIRSSHTKLFDYIGKDMNNMELSHAVEEGKLFLAQKLVRDKFYEQAIDSLQALKCPEASFEQGKIYKKLAEETLNCLPTDSVTSEMRSQHIIILSKARNCFYLTLDRLRSPDADPKHPLNAELCTYISAIEDDLKNIMNLDDNRISLDKNACDDVSEESYSSAQSDERAIVNNTATVMNNSLQTPLRSIRRTPKQSSTPRQHSQDFLDVSRNRKEARPSPERLDAQIRQLVHSIESLKEQNRDLHKTMIAKLDELIKISSRAENSKSYPQPAASNSKEDQRYNNYDDPRERLMPDRAMYEEDLSRYKTYKDLREQPVPFVDRAAPFMRKDDFSDPTLPPHHPLLMNNKEDDLSRYYNPMSYRTTMFDPRTPMTEEQIRWTYAEAYRRGLLYDPNVQPLTYDEQMSMYRNANAYQRNPLYPDKPLLLNERDYLSMLNNTTAEMYRRSMFEKPPVAVNDKDALRYAMPSEPTVLEPAAIPKETASTVARKVPPVNVVITTSDTLPTTVPSIQPTLSVTIPAQHRLGVAPVMPIVSSTQDMGTMPHSYQISMPSQPNIPTTVILPPLSATLTVTSPLIKAHMDNQNQNSSILSTGSRHSSDAPEVEHDPIPDFAPIIPLPDEVPVTTGEENEETLFCARAKLYRFVDKEWKERGVGQVKLLKNSEGKVRLLMRREQVHKICANHMLRPDMELTMMPNNSKAYIWGANDFADEELRLEKLCIKFKTEEEAASFKENFDKAKNGMPASTPATAEAKSSSSLDKKSTAKPAAAAESVQNKPLENLGGFSFSSSPIIQKPPQTETPEKKPEEPAKPSPFASFSFAKTAETLTPKTSTPSGGFSFGSPAASSIQTPIFGQDSSKITLRRPHAPAPAPVVTVKEPELSLAKDSETVIAEQNASLMHCPPGAKVWKESGGGIVKVLSEKSTGKVRFLLNTEDNKKTIFNQIIPAITVFSLKIDTVNWVMKSDKNVTDSYLLRFKTTEQASVFQKTIVGHFQKMSKLDSKIEPKALSELFKPAMDSWECKDCYTRNNAGALICVSCQAPSPANSAPAKPTVQPTNNNLFDKFKPQAGTWECKDCYTRNNAGVSSCIACQAPSPAGTTAAVPTAAVTSTPITSKPLSETFKPASNSWECKQCYVLNTQSNQYCAACDTPKDPSMPPKPKASGGFAINSQAPETAPTFMFGMPQSGQANKESTGFSFNLAPKPSEKTISSPISIFGGSNTSFNANNSSFLFGTQPPSTPPSGQFTFGSPGKSFDFQFQAKSPPVKSPERPETSDDEVVEESEDVYFAPVIPLPDKVDVKTGEENEDVLYSHRAKLFKFDTSTKEWKERGLGDIKLLKHNETKKLRLVMRRDQVLKLCLNHAITSAIEITSKDDKTWMWSAGDYSEGEIEYMQFACRFKTSEIAEEFKKAVDDACNGPDSDSSSNVTSKTSERKDSSQDVQIVYEVKVTPEEKAAALKLQLPENFYAYKYKPDCPGCIGCGDSEESIFNSKQQSSITKPSTPIVGKTDEKPSTTSQPMFGKPATTTTTPQSKSTFGTFTAPAIDASLKLEPPVSNPSAPLFGTTNNMTTSTASQPLFGKSTITSTIAQPKITFGGSATNIFGGGKTTVEGSNTDASLKLQPPVSKPSAPIFGATNDTAPSTTTNTTSQPLFGKPITTNITSTSKLTFGNSATPIFGGSKPSLEDGNAAAKTTNFVFGNNTANKVDTPESSLEGLKICSPVSNAQPSTTTTATTTTSNIFSGFTNSGTSMFGGSTLAAPVFGGSLFGSGTGPDANAAPTKGVFGTNLFGDSKAPVFGESKTPVLGDSKSPVFGEVKSSSTSIFGEAKLPTTNMFGGTATLGTSTVFNTTPSTLSMFSGQTGATPTFASITGQNNLPGAQLGTFGTTNANTTAVTTTTANNVFGDSATKPFSSALSFDSSTAPQNNVFGNSISGNIFGSKPAEDSNAKSESVSFLPTDNKLSFSTLAAQVAPEQQPAFKTDPNFTFEGAGSSVFGAKPHKTDSSKGTPNSKKDKENDDDEEGDEDSKDDHDPYFEPIIPLPDAIEVRTGEEDEEKVFCHRAKLYRYDQDTKEWKERGVGEMKLLHHVGQHTYRLLLRREQVHKVVCNLLLTPDIEFHQLNSSDRAWMWAGMNYAEADDPQIEKLAVRFKSPDLAEQFKSAIDKAQQILSDRQNQVLEKSEYDDSQQDDDYEDEYDGDEYEEEDEDEEEEGNIEIFEKRATLYAQNEGELTWEHIGMGNLKLFYDYLLLRARILVENDNRVLLSDTIISKDTKMECIGKECTWAATDHALDPPARRTLRAVFSSIQAAEAMHKSFNVGQQCTIPKPDSQG